MLVLGIVKSLGVVVGIEVENFGAGAGQGFAASRGLTCGGKNNGHQEIGIEHF